MKVLVTGFQPFGKETTNPSYEAVKLLPENILGADIIKAELPVVFRKSGEYAAEIIRREQPDIVLLVGQAGGRTAMTPERVAINIEDCPGGFPDNEGNAPSDEAIVKDGPAAYFSTVPVEKMVQAIEAEGIKATVSNSAGAFVCNDTLYGILHHFAGTRVRCGFIHVPYIPQQGNPSMELEQIVSGLAAAIAAC